MGALARRGDWRGARPCRREALPSVAAGRRSVQQSWRVRLLTGNLGPGRDQTSAMKHEHHVVEQRALVFNDQEEVIAAFKAGKLAGISWRSCAFSGTARQWNGPSCTIAPSLAVSGQRARASSGLGHRRAKSVRIGQLPRPIHVTPEYV